MVPHSRNTTVYREDVERKPALKILSSSPQAGIYAISTDNGKQIFITGHSEYDAGTLNAEYQRDLAAGIHPAIPQNYYPSDDPSQPPCMTWRAHAHLLYANWLNYFVYQSTPYDLMELKK